MSRTPYLKLIILSGLDRLATREGACDRLEQASVSGVTPEELKSVCNAVQSGVGMAGCHGGMCDAFRDATEWHFMTGGQWVAHPGGDKARYRVRTGPQRSPITEGLRDFFVTSEQYFMHVDPGVRVLATTHFPRGAASGDGLDQAAQEAVDRDEEAGDDVVVMPITWTKRYGQGRVFYTSMGHREDVWKYPAFQDLLLGGIAWALHNVDADVTPNIDKVTPKAAELRG